MRVEKLEEPGFLGRVAGLSGVSAGRLDEARAQHGGEGERDQERDGDGEGGGKAERTHEAAHDSAHEADGQEDREQGKRGGHHGQADFPGASDGGLQGRQAFLFDKAVDIFEHDDGVVDDDTDHQGKGQHGDLVEGEAHGGHQCEGGNDGGGDGDGGDQGGANVGQEEEDDDGGEEAALDQMALDGVDGGLDEDGLIADDLSVDVLGKCGGDFLQALL